ncbi:HPr kinase/phosphatase C-terminal domain-containing protein [Seohaeicola saemankumensis]|nr:HPr kinase/phosphatase C-terminal domain-containing protein [Seohaeicola saemankumensis]MCA0872736.1 HPr kinase/phosphatase C-terminal domain-containing protein [Seohaeicola saemankumensis]
MTEQTILHASCVALGRRALLITGASGSGKSSMALALMAHGAQLVADDRTVVTRQGDDLIAAAPPAIAGLIEARGIGILNADTIGATPLYAVLDLDQTETERLPGHRETTLLGQSVPLLLRVETPHFAAAVLQYLKAGRQDQ